jgi:hypothetical protein
MMMLVVVYFLFIDILPLEADSRSDRDVVLIVGMTESAGGFLPDNAEVGAEVKQLEAWTQELN